MLQESPRMVVQKYHLTRFYFGCDRAGLSVNSKKIACLAQFV